MLGGLVHYHTVLITKNITTNEHMNAYAKYLHNSYNIYDNPFDKGDQAKNIIDELFHSARCTIRETRWWRTMAGGEGDGGSDPLMTSRDSIQVISWCKGTNSDF